MKGFLFVSSSRVEKNPAGPYHSERSEESRSENMTLTRFLLA